MSKGFQVVMWGKVVGVPALVRRIAEHVVSEDLAGDDSAHFASLAAIVPKCSPWASAMSFSSADGWREPSGPASVPAP